jgi:hypothetical protein
MVMMDGLTSTMPDQRLEKMIEDARAFGSKDEAAYYEADVKRQVTQWGTSSTPVLNEYASKVWSGLIRGYYLGRWSAYATSLQNGESLELNEWEFNWINKSGALTKAPTTGDVNKYAVALYKAVNEYVNENLPQVKILLAYTGNNKARVTLIPLSDSLDMHFSVDGTNPSSGGSRYDKPFEVTLPVTVKAVAYHKKTLSGDVALIHIPVSFGKTVSVFPQPSVKYTAHYGATLTDGISASDKFNQGNWLGYEGENLSALISLDGKFKISKISFSYLENGDNLIFAPHSVIVETSADGINYRTVGVHDFDDSKWNMAAKKGELTIRFPETEASHVRLLFFNRGQCPESLSGTGQKAWLFVDEITVE